ncbi:MAG: universal stress protein [Deferrisomatales bacterium]
MAISVNRILAPIDLSRASDAVCAYTTHLARCFGARVTLLYVVETLEELRGLNLPTISYDDLVPDLEARARERLAAYARAHLAGAGDVETRVAHGEPWEVILHTAEELPADLIVMGVHGRKGLERALFGSTTERVIRRAAVPVVAVPTAI